MDSPPLLDHLTSREMEIAILMAEGMSNQEIAIKLVMTYGTVKWYCSQIYSKLGVTTRVQAIKWLQTHKLQPQPPRHHSINQSVLPFQLTSFIGREREIRDIVHLLQFNRLLTLTGTGGIGKTRLALEIATQLGRDFDDGMIFVDLSQVSDPDRVAQAIADALEVIENRDEPLLSSLKRALSNRHQLLVIDNFEHLISAAPLVPALLVDAPHVKVIVTSREALRVSGEQEYAVPPLGLPPRGGEQADDEMTSSESVTLFVHRARMVVPSFTIQDNNAHAIIQICTHLDGLPLAIELAATRSKILPPQAMITRLDSSLDLLTGGSRDAPPRQQTLRQTINWSYNLLNESDKRLFERLAVFRGECSLEAVEAICSVGLDGDVFDGLTSLVEKNLLQCKVGGDEKPRFVMLETIYAFAQERLRGSSESTQIHRRYADYFVYLIEQAGSELRGPNSDYWYKTLELEKENWRAVLNWSVESGELIYAVRLAGAIYLFWFIYGYHVEGERWIKALLPHLDGIPKIYQGNFLICAAHMINLTDVSMAHSLYTRALNLAYELEDKELEAWALAYSGYTLFQKPIEAICLVEKSLALFRELHHQAGLAQAFNILGEISRLNHDDKTAEYAYTEALAAAQRVGGFNHQLISNYNNLAYIALHQGDYVRAKNLVRRQLEVARVINLKMDTILSLVVMAGTLSAEGRLEQAAQLLGASEAGLERAGAFYQQGDKPEVEQLVLSLRRSLGEETFAIAWLEGRSMNLDKAIAMALRETLDPKPRS